MSPDPAPFAEGVWPSAWWFAEPDDDQMGDFRWRPAIREQGFVFTLDVWFPSQKMCKDYIRRVLLTAGLDGQDSGVAQAGPGGAVEAERRQDQAEPCNTAPPTTHGRDDAPQR